MLVSIVEQLFIMLMITAFLNPVACDREHKLTVEQLSDYQHWRSCLIEMNVMLFLYSAWLKLASGVESITLCICK